MGCLTVPVESHKMKLEAMHSSNHSDFEREEDNLASQIRKLEPSQVQSMRRKWTKSQYHENTTSSKCNTMLIWKERKASQISRNDTTNDNPFEVQHSAVTQKER